ncbi:MAG: protease SohB [Myxococcales bacterium]|nr:protease SohB [Myxococcales bacterium]
MIDMLLETLGFALKAGLIVVAFAAVASIIASLAARQRPATTGYLKLTRLNDTLRRMERQIQHAGMAGKALKSTRKAEKKRDKAKKKARGALPTGDAADTDPNKPSKRVFVLDFVGDLQAKRVSQLRQEVTAIIAGAREGDEVLLRLQSPGGAVTGYGLAASQLARLAAHRITLTVAIDQVAASGGYMMAAVADRIIAAPFAVVGSIGVVATVPNVRRLLEKQHIDVEQLTAGEHKRTLSFLGENTDEGRAHFQADLEDIHAQFKTHIGRHRAQVDIDKVATGAHWTGDRAVHLGLVDELLTSDDWLLARRADHDLFAVAWQPPRSVGRRFAVGVEDTVMNLSERLATRVMDLRRL